MAQCNFSVPFNMTPAEVTAKAKTAISNAGGQFVGNEQSGAFQLSTPMGAIRGSYMIEGSLLHVAIDSKPFLLGCGMIESQLKRFF
jgi:hypothetical protein